VQLLHRAAPLVATAGLLGAAAALSPVYATLTASVSSDTVVACTAALLLAHLYLHEYRREKAGGRGLAGSLGLACALCASVLMASRLRSLEQVFALVRAAGSHA
jgi:phosphatidylinositol glycan class C protein